jgi:hypothetical protein
MTWLPRSPGSTLVLRLNQETVHDFILLFMPPCGPHLTPLATGPSNEAYLSSPHLEASPAMTFRACSSPAPTPVKPQPVPAILSQESVHTTLQSLITQRSDHPPVLEPHMVLTLVELAVVLFFLVDILGLLLEPSTNGGRQLLWR